MLFPLLACVMFAQSAKELSVLSGKSLVVDSPVQIMRVALADGNIAEALVTSPRELLIHGRAPGQTSLIVWQQGGNRLLFDLTVLPNSNRIADSLEAINRQLAKELPDSKIDVSHDNNTFFLRGTVTDITAAERAASIVGTAGKVINLLSVDIPPTEAQILLQVKFADVDRGAASEFATNLYNLGAGNTTASTTTGQAPSGRINVDTAGNGGTRLAISDALNVFLFRPDLNLATMIRALKGKRLLEILAEPNVLTTNGKQASFLSGGEFPFPTLQGGGGGLGAVTIQFREFGIRLTFTPTLTPRGTIKLQVAPEVSSLDYANALTFQGFTIPGIATRRVNTEIELEAGQSFAIAGLLDDRTTLSLSKIAGLGDIPFFGRLFRSRVVNKSNTELLVIVTPELVRPMPKGQKIPEIQFPEPFLPERRTDIPRHPGLDVTGPVPVNSPNKSMRIEDLVQIEKKAAQPVAPGAAPMQFIPFQVAPQGPSAAAPPAPPTAPPPAAPKQ